MIAHAILSFLIGANFILLFTVAISGLLASMTGLDTHSLWASFGILAITQTLALYGQCRIERRYGWPIKIEQE